MTWKECPSCQGKGHFSVFAKPCSATDMHKREVCPVCTGSCVIFGEASKCVKCDGKGGFSVFDKPARTMEVNYKRSCPLCCGKGWEVTAAAAPGYPHVSVVTYPSQQPRGTPGIVSGRWSNCVNPADVTEVTQQGNAVTATNPGQAWSPAHGMVSPSGMVTFVTGMRGITAQHDAHTGLLTFTNGERWTKGGVPSVVPPVPVPQPVVSHIAGKFTDPAIPGDEVTIVQAGDALTITNPKHGWSPAQGRIDAQNRLTFTAGGLTHLTASFNPATRVISISNNTQWCALPSAPVTNIAGKFGDPRIQGDEVTIVQAGDALTITNPKHGWSPANGRIDAQNRLTFTAGGLTHLTATFNPATRVISISNNTEWRALPSAPVANIAGKFTDPAIPGDEVTIVQAGDALTITNPKHGWSPANGRIDAHNRLTFTSGGLTHLTATFNPATRVISISNNTQWRALPSAPVANIAGKFTDPAIPGDEVTIVQAGDALTITNPKHGWSPANGRIDAQNRLTFTAGGLTHLTASFNPATRVISISNNTEWRALPSAPVTNIAGKFTDPAIPGDEVTIVQAGDALTITNPKQGWSPANGRIDAQNRLTFTAGGLTHLTATFNPATRVISISNNTEWRALPSAPVANIAGKFTDPAIPGDEVTIVQAGDALTITNPKQGWSPANGRIDAHNRLTFTSGGLTHLTATFNSATRVISISNNTEWRALPSAPVTNIAGKFTDPAIPGDEVTIVQAGDALTITNPKQGWSPANGRIDAQNRLTFTAGGLTHLTASFNPATRVISISNNTQWCPVQSLAQIQGPWHCPTIPGDETQVTQSNEFVTLSNPRRFQTAYAKLGADRTLRFETGLVGVTATLDPSGRTLSLSNGEAWHSGPAPASAPAPPPGYPTPTQYPPVPTYPPQPHSHHHHHHHHHQPPVQYQPAGQSALHGSWVDPRQPHQVITLSGTGNFITATSPGQPWSPAQGSESPPGSLMFSTGLVGAVAQHDASRQEIRFSNGAVWARAPHQPQQLGSAPPASAPKHADPAEQLGKMMGSLGKMFGK